MEYFIAIIGGVAAALILGYLFVRKMVKGQRRSEMNQCVRTPNPICPQCKVELVFEGATSHLELKYHCSICLSHFKLKLVCDAYHSKKQLPLYSRVRSAAVGFGQGG